MNPEREWEPHEPPLARAAALGELTALFLRLGATSFGGPAAHIAMMEEAVVRRRAWLTREEFLDLIGATHLIPGPNSTELALHIGRVRAGLAGLLVAGVCFVLPAFSLVLALAWAYRAFGTLPPGRGVFYAVAPVVIVVILQAFVSLGRVALRSRWLALVAVVATVTRAFGVHELLVLGGAATLGAFEQWATTRRGRNAPAVGIALPLAKLAPAAGVGAAPLVAAGAAATVTPFALSGLFLVFLKVGAVLFGSGYVLLAFLHSDLVAHRGWLTEQQLIDAVAVGQVTPGPVFTAATFVGFFLGGMPGALLATFAIFLPAFVLVALSGPLVPMLRRSKIAGGALDGVNVASVALMAVVTFQLGRAAIFDPCTIALAIVSAVLLLRFRVNPAWLALGAAVLGAALGPFLMAR